MSQISIGSSLTQQHSRSYNAFSGCDIKATFNGVLIGELQGISYTITREKAPIYTLGSKDPRGFSRCKRGIAGSLVFAIFDRESLLDALRKGGRSNVILPTDEIMYQDFRTGSDNASGVAAGSTLSTAGAAGVLSDDPRDVSYEQIPAFYVDQIPPFNIVLNAANEYGHAMVKTIHNVEILNSGTGISVDDVMLDESMTFVCTNVTPWRPKQYIDPTRRIR